jgi:hypothetical protein
MKKIIGFVYLIILSISTYSQWSNDPTINNPICTLTQSNQRFPSITTDGSGGAIILWEDNRNSEDAIYVQRIDASGILKWTTDGVQINFVGPQLDPIITYDGNGGAIIAWRDEGGAVSTHGIYAQRIDDNGVIQNPGDRIPVHIASNIDDPAITTDGNGGAIIVWQDIRNGGNNSDIFIQKINMNNVVQWTVNGIGVCIAANHQRYSAITSDGNGGAIIAWHDMRNGVGADDIYAQRIDVNGNPLWAADGIPICTLPSDQEFPAITSDGNGGAIITWQDERNGFPDIYAQRVDANGNILWTADGIPVCTESNQQINVAITSHVIIGSSSGAILTWQDNRPSVNGLFSIYAQRIDGSGSTQWDVDGVLISDAHLGQYTPVIASDGSSTTIIAWEDDRTAGNGYDIYAQRIFSNGTLPVEKGEKAFPIEFALQQNYPNPFNPSTKISWQTPVNSWQTLKVYDLLGNEITTLLDEYKSAGKYEIEFDASRLPSGVYFYRLNTGNYSEIKKMVLLR